MDTSEPGFLLLPGDGLVLVEDEIVTFVDSRASGLLDDDVTGWVGSSVASVWPAVHAAIPLHHGTIAQNGFADVEVEWASGLIPVRLFATESGHGVGIVRDAGESRDPDPTTVLLLRTVTAMKDAVLITTAEPMSRPGPLIVFANRTFLRESGYTWSEVVGRSPRILQDPQSVQEVAKAFRSKFERWRPGVVEALNYTKDGRAFWNEIRFAPVADETGWFTNWVSVATDVTERKVAHERERQRGAVMRAVLDSMPTASLIVDDHGTILSTSARWDEWCADSVLEGDQGWEGLNYLELCRTPGESTASCPLNAEVADGLESLLRGDVESVRCEFSHRVAAGERRFAVMALPLREGLGALVTHRDVAAATDPETDTAESFAQSRQVILEAIRAADGSDGRWVVAAVTMTNFRDIRDALGNEAADHVASSVVRRIREVVSAPDVCLRLSDATVVVVAKDLDDEWTPESLHRKFLDVVSKPIELDVTRVRPSIVTGFRLGACDEIGAEGILRDAQAAASAAEARGPGTWSEFANEHRLQAHARITAQARVAAALEDDDFVLVFQPIVDLATGSTHGSEALLRIREASGALMPPSQFLAGVDSGPHALDIARWVITQALTVQSTWQELPDHRDHVMSVNVSARQFGAGLILEIVRDALARTGVAPGNLMIEVLEDSIVRAGEAAESELRDIAGLGIGVSIDDFGTGYSALSYLQHFPVTSVKIDRSFLHASNTPRGLRLLQAAAGVARAIGATTVMEGIETREHLLVAQASGIDFGQGFGLGRPLEAGSQPQPCALAI